MASMHTSLLLCPLKRLLRKLLIGGGQALLAMGSALHTPAAEPGQPAAPASSSASAAATPGSSVSAATPAPTTGPAELYACRYGRSRFPEDYAFRDGHKGTSIDFAWSFYVVRTGADITLIDTGFSDPATAKKWGVTPTRLPEELLADLHIAPADVTRVIITHIHFDHVSNLPLFTRAQIVISRRDRDDYVSQKKIGGVTYDPRIAAILGDPARTHVVDLKLNLAFLSRHAAPAIVLLPSHDPAVFARFPEQSPGIARIFGPGGK